MVWGAPFYLSYFEIENGWCEQIFYQDFYSLNLFLDDGSSNPTYRFFDPYYVPLGENKVISFVPIVFKRNNYHSW